MAYVLVLITVFSGSTGLSSQTRFQEFASLQACRAAASALEQSVYGLKGTLGRYVVAQCHALG